MERHLLLHLCSTHYWRKPAHLSGNLVHRHRSTEHDPVCIVHTKLHHVIEIHASLVADPKNQIAVNRVLNCTSDHRVSLFSHHQEQKDTLPSDETEQRIQLLRSIYLSCRCHYAHKEHRASSSILSRTSHELVEPMSTSDEGSTCAAFLQVVVRKGMVCTSEGCESMPADNTLIVIVAKITKLMPEEIEHTFHPCDKPIKRHCKLQDFEFIHCLFHWTGASQTHHL
mmetsp:Transcript_107324/g.185820  ORF Transcript_107324/g.185820 Transcript_107324/m.185820 type:complete len:226 (-) Transcript_107324:201-878(-)